MGEHTEVESFAGSQRDYLDEWMDREGTDEMGMLDLIFVEEILKQRNRE